MTDEPEFLSKAARRLPRRVGEGLDPLARRLGVPSASGLGAVFTRWEEMVGESVAAHAWPVSLTDGVLVVGVDDPAWVSALRFLADELLAKVTAVAGEQLATQIEWRVRGDRGGR